MDNFLDKLKKNKILSMEDILLLKKNINEEHPHLDNSSKANILARSIHSILNENLRGFTKDYKSDIKTYLIKNTILNNKESIYQYDVFKACASSENTSLEFIYQVTKWASKQANEEIALNTIKNIIEEIDIDYNDMVDEISLSKVLEENDEVEDANKPISQEAPEDITQPIDDEECSNSKQALYTEESFENEVEVEFHSEALSEQEIVESRTLKQYIIEVKNRIYKIIHTNLSNEKYRKYILIYSLLICLLIVPFTHIIKNYLFKGNDGLIEVVSSVEYDENSLEFGKNDDFIIDEEILIITSHLPEDLQYKKINQEGLKSYLIERNSLLSSEPYFTTIIDSAREFNINPILLFSIAGHEQSFVPKDHEMAKEIVNNPYNVFRSWKDYNTDIEDSSKIACRTVINLLKDKPENEDPFKWINRKYAEDKNWWKGISSIYSILEKKASLKVSIDDLTKTSEKVYLDITN